MHLIKCVPFTLGICNLLKDTLYSKFSLCHFFRWHYDNIIIHCLLSNSALWLSISPSTLLNLLLLLYILQSLSKAKNGVQTRWGWQNHFNFKWIDCILSWIRFLCAFAVSLMTTKVQKHKNMWSCDCACMCVCVWVSVVLCSNVAFLNEWQALKIPWTSKISMLDFVCAFFMLVYIEWVLGTLCNLYTVYISYLNCFLPKQNWMKEWMNGSNEKERAELKSNDCNNLIFCLIFYYLFLRSKIYLNCVCVRERVGSLKSLLGLFEVKMNILDLVSPSISFHESMNEIKR